MRTKKIAVIGPECTGKSTLTRALASSYEAAYVEEYARRYLDYLDRPYVQKDLVEMARGQVALEDRAVSESETVFCDTDLYVIKVWSEFKYETCDLKILRWIAEREYDLYFLTDIDIPWVQDPQREHPEPKMREYFYHIYKDIVVHSGVPFGLISGSPRERMDKAKSILQTCLNLSPV